MSYCTQDDVVSRIGEAELLALADHDGDGTADAAVVAQAIASADGLIDSYLGARFSVPLAEVPDVVRTRAVDLTVYFLRLGRDSVTDDTRAQYEDDIAWLREAARGRASLGVEPPPIAAGGAPTVRYEGEPRVFGRAEPL